MTRRRLIEVAFPLEEVSAHSRREKNVRHGHISTLHIWWARRPLAACRAFIYASLVDDPETDEERDELLKEVADLANWDAVRKPDQVVRSRADGGSGLTGAQLLERARARILACNGGKPPRLLDPFAGGGAIPLEALRLGCEVEASDLNPVAVLILKGTVEYPQKYGRPLAEQRAQRDRGERESIAGVNGQVPSYIREAAQGQQSSFAEADAVSAYERNPLAADVRYWGNWMLEQARSVLAPYYPPDPDGSVPVAYLWSRTVPCPNCGAEMPLIRQYWLARKDKKQVALDPVVDHANKRVGFRIVEGAHVQGDPGEATTSRGDTICLVCHQVAKAEYVQEYGRSGGLGQVPTAVVLEATSGGAKTYRSVTHRDIEAYLAAEKGLSRTPDFNGLPPIPDEPVTKDPRGLWCYLYGLDAFGKLFNARQLLTLTTLACLVRAAHTEMLVRGLDANYAAAVATYLAYAVDRHADYNSTLARWIPIDGNSAGTFARQGLPMVWDYCEVNPVVSTSGSWSQALYWIVLCVDEVFSTPAITNSLVLAADAQTPRSGTDVVITDPPYYDAINYAALSDFFYVWLKRSLEDLYPDLLALPLTPKKNQIVMDVYASNDTNGQVLGKAGAREQYVEGMSQAFAAMRSSLAADGLLGIVFAHTDANAWSTLIEGILDAGLIPDASWPIDTEREGKVSNLGQARLKTSVWMACRPREANAGEAFLEDVLQEMQPVIRERLLYFWSKGIRGADFFISAIGPALSVFGRHTRVLRPDGSEVTVRDFLDLVRREATQVALEQVLQGADLGVVDPITRQYVTWVWSYGRAPLDTGEAIALCLATGADYRQMVRPHSVATEAREKSKKVVKLRTIKERGSEDEALGDDTPARPAPLIDQLQHAAYLWGLNQPDDLARYRARLGETRWMALRTLGQAVAESLPQGDEDRRLILGLLGSSVMGAAPPPRPSSAQPELPEFGEA